MKTLIVGYTPDYSGNEALQLTRMLLAEPDMQAVICVVVPETWNHPYLGYVDQDYQQFLDQYAADALQRAKEVLGAVDRIAYQVIKADSATEGLMQLATEKAAYAIVLGSGRYGTVGSLMLGSVSEELLHRAGIPVMIAPRHFNGAAQVPRVSCAYSGGGTGRDTLEHAMQLAASLGTGLRIVCLAVRDRQMYPSLVGYRSEELVVNAWREQIQNALNASLAQLGETGLSLETAIGDGQDWQDALNSMPWLSGEILVLGSSRAGLLSHVFLGSNGRKILRASPVPVVVLPRHAG